MFLFKIICAVLLHQLHAVHVLHVYEVITVHEKRPQSCYNPFTVKGGLQRKWPKTCIGIAVGTQGCGYLNYKTILPISTEFKKTRLTWSNRSRSLDLLDLMSLDYRA